MPTTILTHGDWWSINHEEMLELWGQPSLITNDNFGTVNLGLSMYPINLLYGFLYKFISFGLIERLVYFWPSIFLTTFGGYLLGWHITRNYKASLLCSIAFTYSSYFLLMRTGHVTLAVSFACAPLIVLFLLRTLEKPSPIYTLAFALTCCMAGAYEVRGLYLIAWICILLCIFFITHHLDDVKKLVISMMHLLLASAIIIMCNLYWVIGYINIDYFGTQNPLFQRGLFAGYLMSMYRAVSLFHPLWANGQEHVAFQIMQTPIYFFLIPILAFFPLRKRSSTTFYSVFFGVIALLGIFLTKMDRPPWDWVYEWLYKSFPGFGAFRESSKFYFYIAFSYAALIATSYNHLVVDYPRYVRIHRLFFIIVVSIFLSNTLTFIDGSIGTIFMPRAMPEAYEKLKPYYRTSPGLNRILVIPTNSRWLSLTQNTPYINYADFIAFAHEYIKDVDVARPTLSDDIKYQFTKPEVLEFLAAWSIKYVIIPINDPNVAEDFFSTATERENIINFFKSNTHFKSVLLNDSSGQELALFELKDPAPLVLTSLGSGYGAYSGGDMIISARYSPSWVIRTTQGYHAATRDRFGRTVFKDAKDMAGAYALFHPQTYVDRFVWVSFATFGICFALVLYLGTRKLNTKFMSKIPGYVSDTISQLYR